MSGSDKPAGVTQTTSNQSPWSGQQPYLERGFENAENQFDNPREFYPGSTVVPFSPETEGALQRTTQRALGGSPGIESAERENFRTTSGEYLAAGNPHFGAMMERVGNQVRPRIDSQFGQAGRSGGSAGHAEAMSRAMADAGASLAYQDYGAERGRMGQAAQQAPGLYQAGFMPMEQLGQVGAARESQAGAFLQSDMDRFQFGQDEPGERLRQYFANIGGGSYGGSTTTAQPYFSQSPWATGAGIAGALASIYSNYSN